MPEPDSAGPAGAPAAAQASQLGPESATMAAATGDYPSHRFSGNKELQEAWAQSGGPCNVTAQVAAQLFIDEWHQRERQSAIGGRRRDSARPAGAPAAAQAPQQANHYMLYIDLVQGESIAIRRTPIGGPMLYEAGGWIPRGCRGRGETLDPHSGIRVGWAKSAREYELT